MQYVQKLNVFPAEYEGKIPTRYTTVGCQANGSNDLKLCPPLGGCCRSTDAVQQAPRGPPRRVAQPPVAAAAAAAVPAGPHQAADGGQRRAAPQATLVQKQPLCSGLVGPVTHPGTCNNFLSSVLTKGSHLHRCGDAWMVLLLLLYLKLLLGWGVFVLLVAGFDFKIKILIFFLSLSACHPRARICIL